MYDAVIIGSGIAGLVCGCYLAKAGMKVLIAEQHHKPGGYCTSFRRKTYVFDAAAHSFGGYTHGPLGTVFKELGIDKEMNILRFDPSDTVITPDIQLAFWSDLDKTIKEFQKIFRSEQESISDFFEFLFNPDPNTFSRMRKSTFQNMLDSFFKDNQLKAVLSFPLLGNSGLPPSMLSAFIGAKIFKEFLLDGGYYPAKGMQEIPDTLVKKYQEFGGDLRLSCHVKKIRALDNTVSGVYLEKFGFCPSRYVISNCDSRETFFKLVGRKMLPESFMETVRAMKPSLSVFVLYLGMKNDSVSLPPPGINVWYMPTYNIEKAYRDARKGIFFNNNGYLIHVSPDKKTILAFMTAPFKNRKYWDENKQKIKEIFTSKIQSEAIPGLSKQVAYSDAATPYTLFRYTSNYRGASYGWASTPSQLALPDFRKPSFLKNLYCTGHWTTLGLGLPGVAYIGYDTAKNILRREKRIHCGTKSHMKA